MKQSRLAPSITYHNKHNGGWLEELLGPLCYDWLNRLWRTAGVPRLRRHGIVRMNRVLMSAAHAHWSVPYWSVLASDAQQSATLPFLQTSLLDGLWLWLAQDAITVVLAARSMLDNIAMMDLTLETRLSAAAWPIKLRRLGASERSESACQCTSESDRTMRTGHSQGRPGRGPSQSPQPGVPCAPRSRLPRHCQ